MRLWHNLPMAAVVLLAVLALVLIAIVIRPRIQRARQTRYIRNLPPPPVRVVKEVELKLPRRNEGDQTPPSGIA